MSKNTYFKMSYCLLALFVLVGIGEYVMAYHIGDRDGTITNPLIIHGLRVLYGIIGILFILETRIHTNKLAQRLALAGIIVMSGVLASCLFTTTHNWGDDFSQFLMQTKSIIDGNIPEFLTHNKFTITHSAPGIGPVAYPWGFPVLLAPIYKLFGLNWFALKSLNILLFAGFLLTAFWLLKRRLAFLETILIVAVFAVHPILLSFLDSLLSDMPFLFFSTLSMLLIDRWLVADYASISIGRYIAIGATVFAAYEMRTNGTLFLPLIFICQCVEYYALRQKHQRTIYWKQHLTLGLAPYVTFFACAALFSRLFPSDEAYYASYLHLDVQYFIGLIRSNSPYYFLTLLPSFFSALPMFQIIYYLSLPFCAIGIIANVRKDYHFAIYSGFTLGLYLIFPGQQGMRYVFPLLLFWIYFVFQGMIACCSRLPQRYCAPAGMILVYVVWFWMSAGFFASSMQLIKKNFHHQREIAGPFDAISAEMFAFVSERTEPTSIVGFYKPRLLRMLTNRDSLTIMNCEQMPRAQYFVVTKDRADEAQINPKLLPTCSTTVRLEQLYENSRFTIYKVFPRS